MQPYGRALRGFGAVPDTAIYGDTWAGQDENLLAAAQDDDVVGNGIFDGPGAPATAHAGSGVFESHFSLPGYLYREQPGKPSEVVDTTTGAPLVFQPNAGGSWYEDTYESYHPFDTETPRLYSNRPTFPPKAMSGMPTTVAKRFASYKVAPLGAVEGTTDSNSLVKYAAMGALAGFAIALGLAYFKRED